MGVNTPSWEKFAIELEQLKPLIKDRQDAAILSILWRQTFQDIIDQAGADPSLSKQQKKIVSEFQMLAAKLKGSSSTLNDSLQEIGNFLERHKAELGKVFLAPPIQKQNLFSKVKEEAPKRARAFTHLYDKKEKAEPVSPSRSAKIKHKRKKRK